MPVLLGALPSHDGPPPRPLALKKSHKRRANSTPLLDGRLAQLDVYVSREEVTGLATNCKKVNRANSEAAVVEKRAAAQRLRAMKQKTRQFIKSRRTVRDLPPDPSAQILHNMLQSDAYKSDEHHAFQETTSILLSQRLQSLSVALSRQHCEGAPEVHDVSHRGQVRLLKGVAKLRRREARLRKDIEEEAVGCLAGIVEGASSLDGVLSAGMASVSLAQTRQTPAFLTSAQKQQFLREESLARGIVFQLFTLSLQQLIAQWRGLNSLQRLPQLKASVRTT